VECSFCGYINDKASRFCNGCGQALDNSNNANPSVSNYKTYIPQAPIAYRIAAPDGKLDSKGSTLMIHPDGTVVNGKYALYYLTAGGMGAVYLSREINTEEWYIIKEAASSDRDEQLKLMVALTQEREALIRLHHQSIVKSYDLFIDGGACYLVLEYIDGKVLEHIIQETMPDFLPEETVVNWGIQIADILDYLHNQTPPMIYRDLKPDNIMVNKEGQVKVIDFGATRLYKEGKERDTRQIGTAGFAAPEQYGSGQTDCRSDIYSLGATMHYLLTNRYPGDMPFVFPLVRSINPGVSDRIDMIIQKAVQPDMKNRFSTANDIKLALMGEDGERCPICSTVNKKGFKFCKRCGKKTSETPKKPSEIKIDPSYIKKPESKPLEPSEMPFMSQKGNRKIYDFSTKDHIEDLSPPEHQYLGGGAYHNLPEKTRFKDSFLSDMPVKEFEAPLNTIVNEKTENKTNYSCVEPFIFKNGKKASDVRELIDLCRKHPEEGKYHLRKNEFTPWLVSLGIPDYGLEEIIIEEFPEYDLLYFCSIVMEFLEDMKLKKELPYIDIEGIKKLAKKHNLLNLLKEHPPFTIDETVQKEDYILEEKPSEVIDLPGIIINEKDNSEMILIPAGNFIMGKQGGEDNPRHTVYLEAYYIDRYPVTNLQYEKFEKETRYQTEGDWRKYYSSGTTLYPATCLTWKDAFSYLEWAGKRLPTEAEWEKAAAGEKGRLFPWGDTWDPNKCNNVNINRKDIIARMMNIDNNRGIIPVGSIPDGASPYGVEDIAGNIWEWCQDWYEKDYYSKCPPSNPMGPATGKYKVARGGSWKGNWPYFFECSFRRWTSPQDRITFCGFRGVKDV